MKDFQKNLVAAWTDYAAGRIDAKALKGASAGFGIYQQRDDKTMMRVRRPNGATPADLRAAAAILRTYGADYAHLTTRQDIQLHGVPAANVPSALEACENNGFRFRGGGGDTFRNVLVAPFSGLWSDSVFDVRPYSMLLSDVFYGFDLAYALPRKIKIAFADRPSAAFIAQTNDLGFVAKIVDGKRVFETYFAGGIGFKPQVGLKLFDALPAEDCIRVAMALTALFNDKGCRTNRAHARIRFLREDLGDEGLVALFHEYYAKFAEAPKATPAELPALPTATFPVDAVPTAGFDAWRQIAVTPLANGLAAVRVFVPFGNFTPDELTAFADVMTKYGVARLEILQTLDFGFVVPANQLAGVCAALVNEFPGRDYVCHSFVGNIRTCIGCTVCKSGVTDAPAVGRAVGAYFDKYQPLATPQAIAIAKLLLNDVRISGCPNSCTNHPLAKFGFAGRKVNGEDAEATYTPGSVSPVALGEWDKDVPVVTKADFPAFLEQRILASL